jgi:cyclopropane-fatty-acyl-phospholipid synthase
VTHQIVVERDGTPGAGPASIKYHYDVSNEFFFLWLDRTRTYSSAMWDGADDDLASAQLRKLDYLIESSRIAGARRVLDIGCGWGSAMRRMVDHHGVDRAIGVTLSEAQAGYINSWDDPHCEARVENWMDHAPTEPYDAIVSIGAIEHFVRIGADPETRKEVYGKFFENCRAWLPPGGTLSLQTIAKGDVRLDRRGMKDLRFILTEIFPNIDSPWLAELAAASEQRFEMVSLRNDRLDYARTLLAWRDRLQAKREQAVELVGEEVVARHERFFVGSARHFVLGQANLIRMVFAAA